MAKYLYTQNSFSSGQLNERLSGREELKEYAQGAKELTNVVPIDQGGLTCSLGNYYIGSLSTGQSIDFAVDNFCFSVGKGVNTGSVVEAFQLDQVTQRRLEPWTVDVKSTFTNEDFNIRYGEHVALGDLVIITDKNSDFEPLLLVKRPTSFELWKYWDYAAEIESTGSGDEHEKVRACPFMPTNQDNKAIMQVQGGDTLVCAKEVFPAGFDKGYVRVVTNTGTGEEAVFKVTDYSSASVLNVELVTGNFVNNTDYTFWALSAWGGGDMGWPSLVSFYQDRILFGSTHKSPDTIWNSNVGNLFLMMVPRTALDQGFKYFGAVQASDAFDITPSVGQISKLRWIVTERYITCGSERAEFILQGIDGSYSATNSSIVSPTGFGAGLASIGFRAQDATFFVERGNKALRELSFSEENGGYTSRLISLLGPDTESISSVDYSYDTSRIYMADGTNNIYVCTLEKGSGILAWSILKVPETVTEVVVVKDGAGNDTLVYTSSNNEVHLISFYDEDSSGPDAEIICAVRKAQNFSVLDTPTHYTFPTGYGVDGEEVNYITDTGETGIETLTTANGYPAILKPSGSQSVIVYKEPLTSRIKTLPYLAGSLFGSPQLALKRNDDTLFRFYKSYAGVKAGHSTTGLKTIEIDDSQGAYTGHVRQNLIGTPEIDHSVIIENTTIKPFSLVSISTRGLTQEG